MVDQTGFHDVRFPLSISIEAVGGEEFRTHIHITGSGFEYRNAEWDEARGRWDVAHRVRNYEDSEIVIGFFRARRGPAYSFRFPAPDDYQANFSFFGRGDGSTTVFPLYKHYNDPFEGGTMRRIVLPVNPLVYDTDLAFSILVNEVVQDPSNYSVDWRNGRITFNSAPSSDAELHWTGEFDTPCRFGMDHLRKSLHSHLHMSFEEISILEVRPDEILETPD